MTSTWAQREAKRNWARNNPDKVRDANRRWRDLNARKVRSQARERMQRYRARLAKVEAAHQNLLAAVHQRSGSSRYVKKPLVPGS